MGSSAAHRLVAQLLHIPVDAQTMQRRTPAQLPGGRYRELPAKAAFGPIANKAEADGCQIHRFDTGHDIMLEAPKEFADVLLATVTDDEPQPSAAAFFRQQ